MDLNNSKLWSEDVARAVEVYHARRTCLISHPLLAFLAYTAALLSRCGAADDDEKQQGFNTLAYTGRIVTCHRLSQWQLNCIPRSRWKINVEVDVSFDARKDDGATLGLWGFDKPDSDVDARVVSLERRGVRGMRGD